MLLAERSSQIYILMLRNIRVNAMPASCFSDKDIATTFSTISKLMASFFISNDRKETIWIFFIILVESGSFNEE